MEQKLPATGLTIDIILRYWKRGCIKSLISLFFYTEINHRENRGSAEEAEKYVSEFQTSASSEYPLLPLWLIR